MKKSLEKKIRFFFDIHEGDLFPAGSEVYTSDEVLEACLTNAEEEIADIQKRYKETFDKALPYKKAEALYFDRLASEACPAEPGDDC